MSEYKILKLIAKQMSSKEIAASLFVSEKTVKNHRHNIIQKLNLTNEKNSLLKWAANNSEI
jgi:DNA-binding CsgD family transcriptional regulator